MNKLALSVIAASTVLLTGACRVEVSPPTAAVAAPDEVVVSDAPPAPLADVETISPGPGFIWIGGGWIWGPENRWDWRAGHWERPPHLNATWLPDHYDYHNGHHVYYRGHWE